MNVYKHFPVANDEVGIIWTLSSIKDACVVEFEPVKNTNCKEKNEGNLNGEDEAKVHYINIEQGDINFEEYDRLEKAIIEIDKNTDTKYIFIMILTKDPIIKNNILNICESLKDNITAKLIPITTGGLKDEYNVGVEEALEILANKIVKSNHKDFNKYNILGFNIDKYNYVSDVKELERIMKELFNKDVNTIFTADSSIEDIENAGKASLNIVVRKEGLKAAQCMHEKCNIPYIYKNLYGLKNTIKFVEATKKIDGYELDEDKYNKEIHHVKKCMFNMKRKLYFYEESKDCAVFGDMDTVTGMSDMLKELGLKVDRKEILHKIICDELNATKLERIDYLNNKELLILLGDGQSIDMYHDSKMDLQVTNTNLDKASICSDTPYIGFRGCVYIIEKILHIKTE
ncbi:nitrogenase component 1 [Paeniclostridium hominis]|uniref:nitrogenase component 1 n=1 Tax=Paeniclostridium hominis TaxID=2764329 RepID=UPI0022E6FC61|nr:nitrogenase component 1 [Paeniclostridium hominis]